MGCGVDYIYPPENKAIYERILESGGAIISEYSEGIEPSSDKFRQRNRIVSALSLGVLVVEAEYRSGTTITAKYAKEQGKNVFCIPSSITNSKGVGTNTLIRKGATLVQSPNDIIKVYGINGGKQITIEELENYDKHTQINLDKIPEEYREIYQLLCEPLSANEISQKTKMDITEVYSMLFMMELEELIKKYENKYVIFEKI